MTRRRLGDAIVRALLGLAFVLVFAPGWTYDDGASPPLIAQGAAFPRAELVIVSEGGEHRFEVEVARTPAQRAQGLMFRTRIAPDAGMLFVFPSEGEVRMWMKNTLISLDMLFIAADGRITRIAPRTTPLSERTIASGGPVRAVLELAGGSTAALGIEPGDIVRSQALNVLR
ncbi:MAG: DUF192 domain-containing protein [Alphaproteobacteria bacterium]